MKKLRPYQEEAVNKAFLHDKGTVCLPTGSGKTTIQASIILRDMLENPGYRAYLVLAPKIVLSYQLLKEYFIDFNNSGAKFWYAGLHSGGGVEIKEFEDARDGDIEFQNIEVTTSSSIIRGEIEKARVQDIPIIIFGTYHSAERASMAIGDESFDITVCDEGHYLVSDQFESLVKEGGIPSKKTIFFTATMQTTSSDTGKGMNNVERFGEVIYTKVPREMIEEGYMVRPRMHIIRFDQDLDKDELVDNAGKIVAESFHQHEYIIRITGKMLVTCTGSPMLLSILKSPDIRTLKRRKGVSVYAIGSDPEIGNQIDGVQYNRQEFLQKLRADGQESVKRMLILHIDILTEGIDVPGITGILPFRSLKKSKFIQTLGRATRICREDLKKFSDGSYTHHELDKMDKPYAWVMIPDIEGEDSAEDIRDLIRELRTYGFNYREDIFISNEKGRMPPVTLMDPLSEPDTRNPALQEVLEEIHHEFEEEEFANLMNNSSFEELLSHFD